MTDGPAEELLVGDGVTAGIVRVGDTVRRPRRPFSATVQAFLSHLHAAGFTAAPRPLGFDGQGREVLSSVPRDVPREPLPDWATREDVLAEAVNAMYWWAPLPHPRDRAPALVDADVSGRIRVFADAYGMTRELRQQLVPFAVRRARYAHLSARAAAEADPIFRGFWEQGVKDRMPRAEQWWADNQTAIARAVSHD